ncbi:MAG: phosphatidylethanolamine-binding protein [Ignavibacteria bacterium RBG_13_36_8]|nr:MAG: phosphatidylethanolamine-binding protein [Ignavibacteria bacterium RBG_13_36_8]
MVIQSIAFEEGEMIPKKYTCDDKNVSPPLSWTDIPSDTKSFALIYDDPDAPVGTWVHWVIYDIPANINSLPENVPTQKIFEDGTKQGINDFRKIGYGGPCPPGGTHRYFFKLYALDSDLNLNPGLTKSELLKSIEKHIILKAILSGKYKR